MKLPTHVKRIAIIGACSSVLLATVFVMRAKGSDHADTPELVSSPGADITDVHMFPAPGDATKVVLSMCVHPLIPSGQGLAASSDFDPNILYQFKIDNSGDNVEDLVIQAKFSGSGQTQQVQIAGPVAPSRTGTTAVFETPNATSGTINQTFTLTNGVKAFAGAREDPFFFDLERFGQILPDRVSTLPGNPPDPTPNTPKLASFRNPGIDFLAGMNVLSVVVEVPKNLLVGSGTGNISLWCTTSR
jgi:hypothetical protein